MNDIERKMYAAICRNDGIKAREIARAAGAEKGDINRLLYANPFIHELCYRDDDYYWHGLIRQMRPHIGLADFCGYYASAERFLEQSEEEWLEELKEGCRNIGRNLNDTRGLIHSFLDARSVMMDLFRDLEEMSRAQRRDAENGRDAENKKMPAGTSKGGVKTPGVLQAEPPSALQAEPPGALHAGTGNAGGTYFGLNTGSWEICFELRIRRARHVRIYADVLVITEDKVFSLEFKMKDKIDPEEEKQAVKYAKYLDIIFGDAYEVIPALVLTRASDLYRWEPIPGSSAELPVCSGDMLFNLFDEFIGFL
ncbi:MAG: helix-turn-helix domain containing protein [Eubacterium sp.]|nr:helix-turn-helix domain containing protein [Eubacterium sp.]